MIEFIVFLGSISLLNFSYLPIKIHLENNYIEFKSLEDHKKYYVIKNLLKATYLCILSIVTMLSFGPYLYYGIWPNKLLRCLASMYVSNDVVGLYRIKELKTSTRLHHYTTLIFLMVSWTLDFQQSKIAKLMFLYTFASALTFPVNAYLGLRFIYNENELTDICGVAYYVYAIVCMCNWLLHIFYFEFACLSYYCLICLIVYDDIVLLTWLNKKHEKRD